MLGGIPLTEINKTHTSISGIETDSFIITTTTAATATLSGGGKGVQCTKNVQMDVNADNYTNYGIAEYIYYWVYCKQLLEQV